jgi:hypothetical protein
MINIKTRFNKIFIYYIHKFFYKINLIKYAGNFYIKNNKKIRLNIVKTNASINNFLIILYWLFLINQIIRTQY